MKLEVLGCFAPSYSLKNKVSCYKFRYKDKTIFLDMGYFMYKEVTLEELQNAEIFISHNHIDHSYGVFQLIRKLQKHHVILKNKIKIYMPRKSKFFNLYKALDFKDCTEVVGIDEDKIINIGNLEFSFCKTVHKGETYAIKVLNKENKKVFVYTSDLAKVTDNLIDFCKGAESVMLEAGHTKNFQPFTLGKYHGYTKTLTKDILKANPKKVYVTHYKAYATEKKIKKFLPKGREDIFSIVKIGDKLDILGGI